jgi:hypothetical protein
MGLSSSLDISLHMPRSLTPPGWWISCRLRNTMLTSITLKMSSPGFDPFEAQCSSSRVPGFVAYVIPCERLA